MWSSLALCEFMFLRWKQISRILSPKKNVKKKYMHIYIFNFRKTGNIDNKIEMVISSGW